MKPGSVHRRHFHSSDWWSAFLLQLIGLALEFQLVFVRCIPLRHIPNRHIEYKWHLVNSGPKAVAIQPTKTMLWKKDDYFLSRYSIFYKNSLKIKSWNPKGWQKINIYYHCMDLPKRNSFVKLPQIYNFWFHSEL